MLRRSKLTAPDFERFARIPCPIASLASSGMRPLQGHAEQALTDLLTRNSTGITKDLIPGKNVTAEIQFVSCITLRDVLGPFDFVDYVEADLQQSELVVFSPFMDLLRQKVRRLHIGTHGADVHTELHRLFSERGWEIVFSYCPMALISHPPVRLRQGMGFLQFATLIFEHAFIIQEAVG